MTPEMILFFMLRACNVEEAFCNSTCKEACSCYMDKIECVNLAKKASDTPKPTVMVSENLKRLHEEAEASAASMQALPTFPEVIIESKP